jgi:cyclase
MFLLVTAVLVCTARAQEYGKVSVHKVAEGIYLFTTTPYADVGFCGNVTAIVGDDAVLVFDSGAIPKTAETIVSELRKVTDKPVRYLVNSHWHWDHWGGNEAFAKAFPGVQILTYEKNLQMMKEVEPRWNDKGLKEDLPAFVADGEKQLAAAKTNPAISPERVKAFGDRVSANREFLRQKQSLRKILPNVTFSESMTVRLGSREVQIMHAQAITPGDTYLYLPHEKALVTGDIVLNPYPFAAGGTYPAEWSKALDRFATLDPAIVIPGHGDAADKNLVLRNLKLFTAVREQVRGARQRGLSADQTVAEVNSHRAKLAEMVGVAGAQQVDQFASYFLETFVLRAYRELDGPLGDLPDGMR